MKVVELSQKQTWLQIGRCAPLVLDLMDDRVTSFEAGALKPESRIFEVALEKAQCAPEECFYTDDIAAYINKALTFGIHARLFTTTESLRQSLKELSVL